MTQSQETWWRGHLEQIEKLGVGTKQYADEHNLPVQQLYAWRQRFKLRAQRQAIGQQAPRSFLAVTVTDGQGGLPIEEPQSSPVATSEARDSQTETHGCQISLPSGLSLQMSDVPDVQWLLDLSSGLEQQAARRR